MSDYKKTLNLPQTDFPMKANLAQREPEILKKWETINLYQKLREQGQGKETFVLHDGPPYATKDPNIINSAMGRVVTCQNMTMEEFARLLPGMDPSAFRHPALDATGIKGAFDFTINYERFAILNSGGRGGMMVYTPSGTGIVGGTAAPSGDGSGAADPSGRLSIFEAVSKQLGLKLEMQKRPFPVLVIDSIEQKPTEN